MAEYNRNGTLKHMITKIRRDFHNFERYNGIEYALNWYLDISKCQDIQGVEM